MVNTTPPHGDAAPLLRVEGISKRFCTNLKYSLYYGLQDVARQALGMKAGPPVLRKHEFWGLDDISFGLYPGEILAIVGANGSGKTSLMRVISGIYQQDKGHVLFDEGVKTVTPVFALQAGLRNEFTGLENIYLKGALLGMDKREVRRKLDFIVDFSELGHVLHTPIGTYSSGMKARLAYAVSIATEPNLFIIDEALAVGDSFFKSKCFEHLKAYVNDGYRSVLYVTNHIRKVMAVAGRVLVLDQGKLIMDSDDPAAALEYYIQHCMRNVDEMEKKERLQRIKHYGY